MLFSQRANNMMIFPVKHSNLVKLPSVNMVNVTHKNTLDTCFSPYIKKSLTSVNTDMKIYLL